MKLIICILASLVLAGTASAHNRSTWYWNHFKAELSLMEDGIEYSDDTYVEVENVKCFGRGNSNRSSNRAKPWPLYRHFRCLGRDTEGFKINVLLHVTAQRLYVLTNY
jgi:hypothetical protein